MYALSMQMYKMAKSDKYVLPKSMFCMTPLHAQYICIVYAKYHKAPVQVDFLVYALSKHKQTGKKWLSFCQKYFFDIKLLHANFQ